MKSVMLLIHSTYEPFRFLVLTLTFCSKLHTLTIFKLSS